MAHVWQLGCFWAVGTPGGALSGRLRKRAFFPAPAEMGIGGPGRGGSARNKLAFRDMTDDR